MLCHSMISNTFSSPKKPTLIITSTFKSSPDKSILPGLPDDVAKYCLALVPRWHYPTMGAVSRSWREYIKSKEFITVRKLAGLLEEWIYMLIMDSVLNESRWEVMDSQGKQRQTIIPVPYPAKSGFGVAVLDGKLLVLGGCAVVDGNAAVLANVYQYDCYLNSWSELRRMNVGRYDFACTEVGGKVYVAGGYGEGEKILSSVEEFDPDTGTWSVIESLQRPRWGCFGCGIGGKLYVMGGRSSFTIGNSKAVDIYNPEKATWRQIKNGRVMVTAHAVLQNKLFCLEWKNQRRLAVFNPRDNTWNDVAIPVAGSVRVGFRIGIVDGKLLLISLEEEAACGALFYDPLANQWLTSHIKPTGHCLYCVTITS